MRLQRLSFVLVFLIALVAFGGFATAAGYSAFTAGMAPADDDAEFGNKLKSALAPLSAAALQAEAEAWNAKVVLAGQELGKARLAGAEDIPQRAATQKRLAGWMAIVLDIWEDKLGDDEEGKKALAPHRAYVDGILAKPMGPDVGIDDLTDPNAFATKLWNWAKSEDGGLKVGKSIAAFIVILILFRILAAVLSKLTGKAVGKMKKASHLLRDFFVNTVRKLTVFIGLVVAFDQIGINVGPFVAAIGAVGFIIGFALQGTLSNFAAGIMILLYRPYDIGDMVEVSGVTGKVFAMSLVSTTVKTPDNQVVIVPNGSIWGGIITNITGETTRRVDMVFGIGYGDDIPKAQETLEKILSEHELVLDNPEPVVQVHELADSSVNFVARPWAKTSDYWTVYWDITKKVKMVFDEEGISIPFPQQDVHMHQVGSA